MGHVDLAGVWHEASFRLVEVYDVQVPRDWAIGLDRQPYGEIFEVITGVCHLRLGDLDAVVRPGELGVLLPGPSRMTLAGTPGALRFVGFGFRIEHLGAIELSGLLGLPLSVHQPSAEVSSLIRSVVEQGQIGSPSAALRARGHAELATAELVESVGQLTGRHARPPRPEIAAALSLMEADLSAPLDVATLARTAHLSPKHFARCFRDVVGVPPMAYLQAIRLSRARLSLASTQHTVSTVALAHGFADAPHFTRTFKRQYGMTPSQFRHWARDRESELDEGRPPPQARPSGSETSRGPVPSLTLSTPE